MKSGSRLKQMFLSAAFVVPLSGEGWQSLAFRKIPPNEVKQTAEKIVVSVDRSAGPLIYRLESPRSVTRVRAKGRWEGELKGGLEDSLLRIGLVVKGDKKLNFMQKAVAPQWIKKLHELAPKDQGIDRIEFVAVTSEKSHVGKKRVHPLSELMHEIFAALTPPVGPFALNYTFPSTLDVLALWISIDGDDTGSKFQVEINEIVLD